GPVSGLSDLANFRNPRRPKIDPLFGFRYSDFFPPSAVPAMGSQLSPDPSPQSKTVLHSVLLGGPVGLRHSSFGFRHATPSLSLSHSKNRVNLSGVRYQSMSVSVLTFYTRSCFPNRAFWFR